MAIHLLSPREVQVAENGTHSDGGGQFLWVNGQSASWLFRYTSPDGRRREMGLGRAERSSLLAAGDSVKRARKAAAEQADRLDEGVDPLDERKRRRREAQSKAEAEKAAASAEKATLARVAREYHERVIEPKRTTKHAAQWISSLERNVPESIWNTRVDSVDHVALFEALAALQARIPVTAARVRQRLELVFDHAEFYKMCTGNPARIVRRRLTDMPKGREPGRFAALPFAEVPMFIAQLRQQPGTAARALEFAILTAARTGDIRGATWEEIDAERTIWRIPAPRASDPTLTANPLCIRAVADTRWDDVIPDRDAVRWPTDAAVGAAQTAPRLREIPSCCVVPKLCSAVQSRDSTGP